MKAKVKRIAGALAVLAVIGALTAAVCLRQLGGRGGDIYLYGELHSDERFLSIELAAWPQMYHQEGARDLFIESPCYTAEFLNMWMRGEDEDMLERPILEQQAGTQGGTQLMVDFYRALREDCPETVFHGTDVGHQYDTTGALYLEYLEQNGRKDSEEYRRAQECMGQGETFYQIEAGDEAEAYAYREDRMAENFAREYERLGRRMVMGIYGSAHAVVGEGTYMSGDMPNMASQLAEKYPDVNIGPPKVSLADTLEEPDRSRKKTVTIAGKEYDAWYGGRAELPYNAKFSSVEVWAVEGAYEDVKDLFTTGITILCAEYPLPVETGQVFQVEAAVREGGNTASWFFRSDGKTQFSLPVTEQIKDG